MGRLIQMLAFIGIATYAFGQQEKDQGLPELKVKVAQRILTSIEDTLAQAQTFGTSMPEPDSLMPAQEALQWISGRAYMLDVTTEWPSPETTEMRFWADCKGKSLWLADRLLRLGYRKVTIVIGKIPSMPAGHAWVELNYKGKDYILDGTYRGRFTIIPKDRATLHAEHVTLHRVTADNYTGWE